MLASLLGDIHLMMELQSQSVFNFTLISVLGDLRRVRTRILVQSQTIRARIMILIEFRVKFGEGFFIL